MCGLFAVIPTIPVTEALATKLRFVYRCLALNNDSRGGHSWGMWSYDYLPYKGLGKIGDNITELVYFTELWKPKRLGWLAGHTRFGTHGAKTAENSHPFIHGDLTLAHNGVVTVKSDDAEVKAHPVDSGQLCIAASKFGLADALAVTTGMVGLLFHGKDRKLYAYRSDQVLHVAKCAWGYAVSSDKYHLRAALTFCGFGDAEITEFKESTVLAPWYEDFIPYEVKTGGLTKYTPAWNSGAYAHRGGYYDGEDDYTSYRGSSTLPSTYPAGAKVYDPTTRQWNGVGAAKPTGPVSDYDSKVAAGIIKVVKEKEAAGEMTGEDLQEVLAVMDGQVVSEAELDLIEQGLIVPLKTLGCKEPIREFQVPHGELLVFNPSDSCDCCGCNCDEDGGFFLDPEMPNSPMNFCKECLIDLAEKGIASVR